MRSGKRLLIACGNSLRQDDGAGLLLAAGLAAHWQAGNHLHRYIQVQQLVPELALEIASPEVEMVWFVDSRVASDESDTALQIRPLQTEVHSQAIGHQLSPELLLVYAKQLFDTRPPEAQPAAWQITIPGYQFDHGDELSDACRRILERSLRLIRAGAVDDELLASGEARMLAGESDYA